MKIILTNGAELEPLSVQGAPSQVQGAKRDTLTFIFPSTAGLEALDAAFSAANCETIRLVQSGDGDHAHTESIYTHYVIRAGLTKRAVEVTPATAEADAVYQDQIFVSMAQRTYAEVQMAQLQAAVAELQAVAEPGTEN